MIVLDAHKTRHEEPNYRVYQFAGAAHLRDIDAAEFGLADPEKANPADWMPFFRALFVAGDNWCDGIEPPPSIWLGAPNDPKIVRDANGNALVSYVGGQPVNTTAYRLPEVAVGENQYIPLDPPTDGPSSASSVCSRVDMSTSRTASPTTTTTSVRSHTLPENGGSEVSAVSGRLSSSARRDSRILDWTAPRPQGAKNKQNK